jgi:hypothetical protein
MTTSRLRAECSVSANHGVSGPSCRGFVCLAHRTAIGLPVRPAARMKSCRFLPVIPHEWNHPRINAGERISLRGERFRRVVPHGWNHPRINAGERISLAGRTISAGRSAWLEPSEDQRR